MKTCTSAAPELWPREKQEAWRDEQTFLDGFKVEAYSVGDVLFHMFTLSM